MVYRWPLWVIQERGKSTLTAYCTSRGAGFLTDDILVVDDDGFVIPNHYRLKLHQHTCEKLGVKTPDQDRYKVFFEPSELGDVSNMLPVRLGTIYLLFGKKSENIYAEKIPPSQAAFELLNHSYAATELIKNNPKILSVYINLVDKIEVRRLHYPHDFDRLPDVFDFLLKEHSC